MADHSNFFWYVLGAFGGVIAEKLRVRAARRRKERINGIRQ